MKNGIYQAKYFLAPKKIEGSKALEPEINWGTSPELVMRIGPKALERAVNKINANTLGHLVFRAVNPHNVEDYSNFSLFGRVGVVVANHEFPKQSGQYFKVITLASQEKEILEMAATEFELPTETSRGLNDSSTKENNCERRYFSSTLPERWARGEFHASKLFREEIERATSAIQTIAEQHRISTALTEGQEYAHFSLYRDVGIVAASEKVPADSGSFSNLIVLACKYGPTLDEVVSGFGLPNQ